MKPLRWLALALLLAGAGLIGRALYLHAKAELAGVLIRRAWAETLRSGKPNPPWPWADTHPVARLEIPRLGYDEIVLEGASPRTLAFGPARVDGAAVIGTPGNVVLAGHRTSWFRPLEHVRQGDGIRLTWFDPGRHEQQQEEYLVESVRIVRPENVDLLLANDGDVLTLVTCYPFGSRPDSPLRYVVRAVPQQDLGAARVSNHPRLGLAR
jgi:sortase A